MGRGCGLRRGIRHMPIGGLFAARSSRRRLLRQRGLLRLLHRGGCRRWGGRAYIGLGEERCSLCRAARPLPGRQASRGRFRFVCFISGAHKACIFSAVAAPGFCQSSRALTSSAADSNGTRAALFPQHAHHCGVKRSVCIIPLRRSVAAEASTAAGSI